MRTQSAAGRWFAVIGSYCLFAPLIGFLTTGIVFIHQLAIPANDAALRRDIGLALINIAVSSLVSMLGYCLAGIAIFAFQFRPPWLRRNLMIGSLFLLPAFPLGTVFALVVLIPLIWSSQAFVVSKNT